MSTYLIIQLQKKHDKKIIRASNSMSFPYSKMIRFIYHYDFFQQQRRLKKKEILNSKSCKLILENFSY